jgi:uncharacterized protein (DUF983 family)
MFKDIFYSTLWNKCPRCHKTNVFITNNAFDLKRFDKMNDTCDCCGLKYEREPGYFYGAMYVSYALMVGWFVITWGVDSFIIHSETWQYLTFLISTIILFSPITFRISRLLWLNFFVKYDKSKMFGD